MRPRFVEGNAIRLLENGGEYFPALTAAIDSAKNEVHLETYIFANDATAKSIVDALARARGRGVEVRVMVDGFGARNFSDELGRDLLKAGCEVLIYRAEAAKLRFRRNRLRRLHRKLVVVDGRIAFVGGLNIIDDSTDTDPGFPRYDYAVSVEGPLVADIHHTVRQLWRLVRWATMGRRPDAPTFFPLVYEARGDMRAAFLIRDNLRHRRDIQNAYLGALYRAEREFIIASAYFLPGKRFRQALVDAAQRGVHITLLLQSRGDHMVLRYAERFLYDTLIGTGIEIVEYRAGFLHAKVGVADGRWATVGSSNIDPFSLMLAREANVVVTDREFATALHQRLRRHIETGGVAIRPEDLKKRSYWMRFLNRAAYAFVRVAVSISRYGGKDYRE